MPRRPTDRTRAAAALLLCVLLAGCSTYQAVQLSTTGGEEGSEVTIPPGTEVRATTVTGEVIEGEMIAVRGDSLHIGQPGNYGYREYVLGLDEVALLEARQATPGASTAISVTGIVLLTGTALVVALLVALSRVDLGGMS